MVYRAIGLMSGSSLDGLDIAFVEFHEDAGKWGFEALQSDCYPYDSEWTNRLKNAVSLSALDYQLLHTAYGHYLGQKVNHFIETHQLHYRIALIASHGHTTFHLPAQKMTAQLGDGAAIAAETGLPVVTGLRALDIALGGQGAPIVPIGEKLLWPGYDYFLNIGGIANISATLMAAGKNEATRIAFDVCPANRVLNMLANDAGKEYDAGGSLAASGKIDDALLNKINALDYYALRPPKSLANDFGTDIIYPMIKAAGLSVPDALRTFVEHIAEQIMIAVKNNAAKEGASRLLATGGGALNVFLIKQVQDKLRSQHIDIEVPDNKLVNFKEAIIIALFGILRWRQEYNVLSSVTGAARDSIGGALWTGEEA